MSHTIAVPERLAARLEQKAQLQRTTVESLVVTILDAAVERVVSQTGTATAT